MTRILKPILVILTVIILGSTAWWLYITYTFVEFHPLKFETDIGLVPARTNYDFYKNLRVVLDVSNIKYKLDVLDHPWIQLKVARDKELVWNLTTKAEDIVWLYNHKKKEKHPSFPCGGDEYSGFVFEKEFTGWWGKGPGNIDLTCNDVALAEQILNDGIVAAGGIDKWHIDYKLREYYRQYLGYRNTNGDSCVHIELTVKPVNLSKLQDELNGIKDGGSAFWRIDINLSEKKVINYSVNGGA